MTFGRGCLALFLTIGTARGGWATVSMEVEVPVRLFESKCTLSGPRVRFTPEELLKIHDLSPEKLLSTSSAESAALAAKRLMSLGTPHSELERYLKEAKTYIHAVEAFFLATKALKESQDRDHFTRTTEKWVERKQRKNLRGLAESILNGEESDTLLATWGEMLGPLPDEEFHRAIRRMKVRYQCVFDRGN